jgi:hypothetical protein
LNLEAEIDRGAKAETLLKNETYREAVGKVRQGILDLWSNSPIRDVEGQTYLRLQLKALDDIEKNIQHVANTGKLAMRQREHERTMAERAREAAAGLIAKFT